MISFFKFRRGESRPLGDYMTRYLSGTYGMEKPELNQLRCAQSSERIAGRKVKLFRVFDPRLVGVSTDPVTYSSLDDSRDTVLFEGRFAANGTITEIEDRRMKQK